MSGLKEIRNRISSIGSTMQITNAMKMVSASKLRRAQDGITAILPYAEKINELIQKITSTLSDNDIQSPYGVTRDVKKVLLVAVTSNKGLCGGFNSNIVKEIKARADHLEGKEVSVAAIGKKGRDVLKKLYPIALEDVKIFDHLNFKNAEVIARQLMQMYADGRFDKIILVYNHFINAAVQQVEYEQFLPILPPKGDNTKENIQTDYIFEPGKAEIVETLIPKALKIQFFRVLRDSLAGEHGARMTAMHKATDNAQTLKSELTLSYNKARQAAITSEILEIVGGAEALK